MSFAAARFDSTADTYDDDPHHLLIAQQLVAGLRPTPRPELVAPTGSPPHISTAQLPAERTGDPPEYAGYEGRLAGALSGNLDPPIYATDARWGPLVVDVATGTGFAALTALEVLAPRRVVAIDVSPRMIEKAAAKNGRIEWRVAPAVPLDLPDGVADVVLCASALHLIGATAPPEWRRVLRPGGQAAFSLPMAADFHPSPEFRAALPTDLPVPADEAGAERIARAAGLESVRVATTPPPRRAFLVWAEAPA